MRNGVMVAAALSAALILAGGPLWAQQREAASRAPAPDQALGVDDLLAPSQMNQPMPAPVAAPSGGQSHASAPAAVHATAAPAAVQPSGAARQAQRMPAFPNVVCSGPFAADSGNLSLAMAFDSRNVVFTDVDGGSAGKVPASVIYPKDPKRRLEVWWSDPATRTRVDLIVINGQSGWIAPRGLHLGQGLAEIEKLNHKPFKLKGFDKNNVAAVSDWNGGALADLPGGCKAGVSLRADHKAAEGLSELPADKEFSSTDAAIRAAKPVISEILLGY